MEGGTMTTLELLLLLLMASLAVIGITVAVTLNRIFRVICLVTDPIATVLERLKGQEWQERHLLRHASDEEPRDPDEEWDADQTLEAAIGRYRHALLHCHECEEAAQEAITQHEARK